jgi:hypothetical protein
MMRPLLWALMLLWAAQSYAEPLLVEMFTSTNCPSCPATEAEWAQLAQRRAGDVMVVLQHVDYWNKNARRPDPWALPEVTERQYDYSNLLAKRAGLVWTPQPVLDGASVVKNGLFLDLDQVVDEARAGMKKQPLEIQIHGDAWHMKAEGIVSVMALEPVAQHPSLWRAVGMATQEAHGKVTVGPQERPPGNRWLVVVQAEAGGPITHWKIMP